jgi:hypothetical protein
MGLFKAQFRKEIMIFNRYLNTIKGKFLRRQNRKTGLKLGGEPLSCLTIFSGFDDKEKLRKITTCGPMELFFSIRSRLLFKDSKMTTPLNLVGHR